MKYTIIAECGINHQGDVNYARKSIEVAKEIGCDIWKTQLYNPEALFPDHKVMVEGRNWYPEVRKTNLSFDQVVMLKKHCDEVGIEFMASAFDYERLQGLEDVGVKRHKIASKMNKDVPFICKVLETGKEVLFSTHDTNISQNIDFGKISFLYCVSKYPTNLSDLDFMYWRDDCWEGFSDHTIGIEASIYAMAQGAEIIEKHFKLSESDIGPDMIISSTPDQMSSLVKFARAFEEINK